MRNPAIAAICFLVVIYPLPAQRGGDWMTGAYDPQRSSWVRSDGKISRQSVQKAGLDVVWKLKLDNTARQLNSLTPPALLDFYIGYRGFRALAFFGDIGNRVIAVDTELGRIEWEKDFGGATGSGTLPCPGGMTSAVTRPTVTAYPTFFAARGAGRGTPAKSGVGEADQGAVTIKPGTPPPRPPVRRNAPAASGGDPYAARILTVMALSGDGKLHTLWVSNGDEPNPAVPFLPANANASGLIAYDNTAYAATSGSCGGVDNGVWALDLRSKEVSHWKAAAVSGTAGPAVRPDGSLFVAGGRQLTALSARKLQPLGSFTADAEFTSSPLIFDFKGKDIVAATTNDGRLVLLAADLKAGPLDRTPQFFKGGLPAGALTSWQDQAGTRWILIPAGGGPASSAGFTASNGEIRNGAIVAWRVVDKDGGAKLEPGWISRDMVSPLTPIVVNGVVFAVSGGGPNNAVLYGLDPFTGKELWNSGSAIASYVRGGGLAAGGGRVYLSTVDGTQYAFGFPSEH